MSLKGKVALITGAASGMGKQQALYLAAEGVKIIAVDMNQAGLNEVVDTIKEKGGEAISFMLDITKSADVADVVAQSIATFGKIDVLCNTAGIFDKYATIADISEDRWKLMFDVNVNGIYNMIHAVLPNMLENKKGTIINMCSDAGLTGGGGGTAYVATKHAVAGITKQVCLEFASQGIRSLAIAPGSVMTEMHKEVMANDPTWLPNRLAVIPAKRLGVAEDAAKLTVALCADELEYMNGVIVPIDGGRYANGAFYNF